MSNFLKVKNYINELGLSTFYESEEDGIIVIDDENSGINKMVLGIADPILIIEQFLFEVDSPDSSVLTSLLKKNRDIIHGAFCLDENAEKVIFRDTLQLENLDLNELEATLNSLSLLLTEFSDQILSFSQSKTTLA